MKKSPEMPVSRFGPRAMYGAASTPALPPLRTPQPPLSAFLPPLPPAGGSTPAPVAFRKEPTMNCLLCGKHYAGPGEMCCDCLGVAFPNGAIPAWVTTEQSARLSEVPIPQPIS
jgi:hypothetical protein